MTWNRVGWVDVYLRTFILSGLDRFKWSTSWPAAFLPRKESLVPWVIPTPARCFGDEQLPVPDIDLRLLSPAIRSLVTIPTEIARCVLNGCGGWDCKMSLNENYNQRYQQKWKLMQSSPVCVEARTCVCEITLSRRQRFRYVIPCGLVESYGILRTHLLHIYWRHKMEAVA